MTDDDLDRSELAARLEAARHAAVNATDAESRHDLAALALRAVILELRDRYPPEIWAAYLHVGA